MHLSGWSTEDAELLDPLLNRLNSLLPKVEKQTHILHLATNGEILPHIDNVEASGSWILGVSLGYPRIMRMENIADPVDSFELLLPPGSVYIQR